MKKQILQGITAAFLLLALVSCGINTGGKNAGGKNAGSKTNASSNTSSAAGNEQGSGAYAAELTAAWDWKDIYLGELLAAQEYSATADFENHDPESMYPLFLNAAYLIDLNFDGIPELLLFGPPTHDGYQEMHIFTINGDSVRLIFRGWGDMDSFKLYRKAGSNIHAFAFESGRWDMTSWIGAYYLTTADTKMDRDFSLDAIFARFSERRDFDGEGDELDTTYTFNSKEVSQNDYNRLMYNMFAGYEELPYLPKGMIWNSEGYGDTFSIALLSPAEIMPFLDSFDEEDGMGDP